MPRTFVVHLRGASHGNGDGTSRQKLLAQCRTGEELTLRAEPSNPHDRNAVAVLNLKGQQLGYLPSDARDASSLLQGQRITAVALKRLGGPRWWHKICGVTRSYGLLIRLTKGDIDWSRHNKLRERAERVDALVKAALAHEKAGATADEAIKAYQSAVIAVTELNSSDPVAAAHRYVSAPVNRLTLLLVIQKRGREARQAYEVWKSVSDPIGLPKAEQEAVLKRMSKVAAI